MKTRTIRFAKPLLVFLLVMLLPSWSLPQEVTRNSLPVKAMKSQVSDSGSMSRQSFKVNPNVHSLRENRRSLSAGLPTDLASELDKASLPAGSMKKYSLPWLAGANLMPVTKYRTQQFRNFSATGLNTSKLLDAKYPELEKAK